MYYYEIYVENNQGTYTYKSEEKYKIGQWCIVNFINKDKMGLIIAIVNENQIRRSRHHNMWNSPESKRVKPRR